MTIRSMPSNRAFRENWDRMHPPAAGEAVVARVGPLDVKVDPAVPAGELHVRNPAGETVARITNLAPPDPADDPDTEE